jgi:hypothetical protein
VPELVQRADILRDAVGLENQELHEQAAIERLGFFRRARRRAR